jgi:hypothetical protein
VWDEHKQEVLFQFYQQDALDMYLSSWF